MRLSRVCAPGRRPDDGVGHPAQPDALVGHHAEKDGESKAISAWKKRQMRVCLLFCVGKPLSLLRRQGRVAAPSIRSALLASCWPLPQQLLPVSATGGGRRCCPCRGEPLAGRAALSWTLEAQYGAKGRALLQRAAASGQCTLSSCRWLGQQGTTVHETDKLCSSRGNLTDMPRALPLGELARSA